MSGERERQRAALEADTLTSDPLREVERDSLQLCVCVCVCWVGTVEKEGVLHVHVRVLVCVV